MRSFTTAITSWALQGLRGSDGGERSSRPRRCSLADDAATVQISAVAWYELRRGPRTPAQLAVALSVLSENGVVPLDAAKVEHAADAFRRLGSPRKRAQDIAIGVTAKVHGATLLTRNARDFRGIDGLVVEALPPAPQHR